MNTTHPRPNKSNQLICYPAMYRSQLPPDFFVVVDWLSISNHPRTLGPVQGFYGTEAESIYIYIYVFEQLNIHISTVFAGCSEASNRIKPFLRRGSGHPSADEDLLRHESHSGRSAADDSRHSESRDPPGDSNDTSSSRDLGAVVVEWGGCLVLRATCRCFLFIHHLG